MHRGTTEQKPVLKANVPLVSSPAAPEELLALFSTRISSVRSLAAKYFAEGTEEFSAAALGNFISELSSRLCGGYDFRPAVQQIGDTNFDGLIMRIRQHLAAEQGKVCVVNKTKTAVSCSCVTEPDLWLQPKAEGVDAIEEQLSQAISRYENLLALERQQGKDERFTQRLLTMMQKQLAEHRTADGGKPKAELRGSSLEAKRLRGLKEIFEFYCKKQMPLGKKATFDRLSDVISHMTLGELTKLCRDFDLPISTGNVKELFKRKPYLGRTLDWPSFQVSFGFYRRIDDAPRPQRTDCGRPNSGDRGTFAPRSCKLGSSERSCRAGTGRPARRTRGDAPAAGNASLEVG